jgi:hypothetical protein
MLGSLLSAIVETLFTATSAAIVKLFGWESAIELVQAIAGLVFIVVGVAIVWLNH